MEKLCRGAESAPPPPPPGTEEPPKSPVLIGLREQSNAEETLAIFANSGKFAKVCCREIFSFREFPKVYSREKLLFSIRES